MKKKRRLAAFTAAICLSILCMGAANPFQSSSRKEQQKRLETLEKQNADLRQQVIDLKMKLDILTQRVNASCGGPAGGATFTSDDLTITAAPPSVPGLEVVRLKPESREPAKPKGRLIVTRSDPESTVLVEHGVPLPGTSYVPLPDPETTLGADGANNKSGAAPVTTPMARASTSPVPARDEISAFNPIKELVDEGKADEAAPLMEEFLKQYKNGAHEDRVAYWLGTHLVRQGRHGEAVKTLKIVTENHYESDFAPEALYEIGQAYLELGQPEEAGSALREIRILYPFSETAEKAQELLSTCCP
jgi:TolA-binding protein